MYTIMAYFLSARPQQQIWLSLNPHAARETIFSSGDIKILFDNNQTHKAIFLYELNRREPSKRLIRSSRPFIDKIMILGE